MKFNTAGKARTSRRGLLFSVCCFRPVFLFAVLIPFSALAAPATSPATQQQDPSPTEPSQEESPEDQVRRAVQNSANIGLAPEPGGSQSAEEAALEDKTPEPLTHYLDREIARTMSFHGGGAQWLVREEREREERCSLMLVNLNLKRGMSICDMGCGVGFHTLPMAQVTGERGRVYAVDVQPEMLAALRDRTERLGVENVIPILGSYHNPRLPPDSLDLVLMVDVYHEFSHPVEMLASIRQALKPDGRMVLLEYRAEDPDVPIKRLHKMSLEQIEREMTANGFKLVEQNDELPWQHMVFYGRDESWTPEPLEGPGADVREPDATVPDSDSGSGNSNSGDSDSGDSAPFPAQGNPESPAPRGGEPDVEEHGGQPDQDEAGSVQRENDEAAIRNGHTSHIRQERF